MALSEKDKKDIAEMVAASLAETDQHHRESCRFVTITPDQHRRDHEALQDIAQFFRRINEIKWNSLKFITTLLIGAAVVAVAKAFGFSIQGPGGP